MLKNGIIKTSIPLVFIMALNTGCVKPEPQVINMEHNITKEVLIPHDESVKKAIVILIKKVKVLEKQMNSDTVILQAENSTVNEVNNLKNSLYDLKKQIKKLSDNVKSNKIKLANDIKKVSDASNSSNIIKKAASSKGASSNMEHYDAIIKEFSQESLK